MPDSFGPLKLPLDVPDASTAVGDPLLDITLDFVKAVVNAKTQDAWAVVQKYATPGTSIPLPISFVVPNEPSETFDSNKLPSLFAWRMEPHKAQSKFTQEWLIRESTIALLWIPPFSTQEQNRVREPFRNAMASAIAWAFERGRDPAWIADDEDDYFDAQTYGSTWRQRANVAWHWLRQIRSHPIQLEYDDGPKQTIRAVLAELDVREVIVDGLDRFGPLDHIEGTVRNRTLPLVPFTFKMAVTSVSPSTGTAAGGTTLTLRGKQFADGATVTIDGADAAATYIDETTLTVVTPAHAAGGPYDLIVTNPSGASSTLAAAFTYT